MTGIIRRSRETVQLSIRLRRCARAQQSFESALARAIKMAASNKLRHF
jgi:hypothetical protein